MILSAVCQTIGLGILMYLPCPSRANVLEFPGFSLRCSPFSFSSLYCDVLPSVFFHFGIVVFMGHCCFLCILDSISYCCTNLELNIPHLNIVVVNFVLNRTPKWVSTTILKSHKGDCFRGGFGSLWSRRLRMASLLLIPEHYSS